MIRLFYGPTPNGHKVSIMLEEACLPYAIEPLNTFAGQQFTQDYLTISPSAKMPAIIDEAPGDGHGPFSVFESGAILLYLARKSGMFYPQDLRGQSEVEQWLLWQMAALGPMSGQASHFVRRAREEGPSYPRDRYVREVGRLYAVLEHRLTDRDFVAGDYSIADMAIHPWIRSHAHFDMTLDRFPAIGDWMARIDRRPAVIAAYALSERFGHAMGPLDDRQKALMFACSEEDMRRAYAGEIQPWA